MKGRWNTPPQFQAQLGTDVEVRLIRRPVLSK